MEGATRLEKAALVPAMLSAFAIAALVEPDGYIASPAFAFGALLAGLVSSLMALALAVRAGRPKWLRWAAAGESAAFVGAAGWLVYFLSTVPLS